jgi:hypothetical protein
VTPGTLVRVRGSSAVGVVLEDGSEDDAGDGCVHVVARSHRGEAWVHPVDLDVVGRVDERELASLRAAREAASRPDHDFLGVAPGSKEHALCSAVFAAAGGRGCESPLDAVRRVVRELDELRAELGALRGRTP